MAVSTVPCFLAPEQLVSLSGKILRTRTFGLEDGKCGASMDINMFGKLVTTLTTLVMLNVIGKMQFRQENGLFGKHFKSEAETLLPSKAKALEDSPRRSQNQIRVEPVPWVKKNAVETPHVLKRCI